MYSKCCDSVCLLVLKLLFILELTSTVLCEDCYGAYGSRARSCRAGWRCCGSDCCLENPFYALWYLWFLLALMLISCVMFICICCKWKKQNHLNHIHSAQHGYCQHHPYPYHPGGHVFDVSGSMAQPGYGMYHPFLIGQHGGAMMPGYANEGLANQNMLHSHMFPPTAPDLSGRIAPPSYSELMHPKPPSIDGDNNNDNDNQNTIAKAEDDPQNLDGRQNSTIATTNSTNQQPGTPRLNPSLPPINTNVGILSNQTTAPELNSQSDAPPAYASQDISQSSAIESRSHDSQSISPGGSGSNPPVYERTASETAPKVPITPRCESSNEDVDTSDEGKSSSNNSTRNDKSKN